MAGAFFARATTFVAPCTFTFFQSILFVLVVIIGGAERTYGPVIGAAIVVGAARSCWPGFAEYRVLLFGVLLLAVLLFAPSGIAGALAKRFRRAHARGRRAPRRSPRSSLVAAGTATHRSSVSDIGISFGGLRAVSDVSATRRERQDHQHHRPQRRRQDHRCSI